MIRRVRPRFTPIVAVFAAAMLAACSSATPAADDLTLTTSPPPSTSSPVPSTSATPTPGPTTSSTVAPPTSTRTTPASPRSSKPSSEGPEPTGNGALPTDLNGTVYGYVKAVDVHASQLTVDKVDWFTGAAAEQACAEDAVPQEARLNEWCSMYYFRNVNPALRDVTVSESVAVTTLDGNQPVAGDLASLAARITTVTGSARPYRLTVTDGVVVDVMEVYQP